MNDFPQGPALLTVTVNGIPSAARALVVSAPSPVLPILLQGMERQSDGSFRFRFSHTAGGSFKVLATTDPLRPMGEWTPLDGVIEESPGEFRFVDPDAATLTHRYYRVARQ